MPDTTITVDRLKIRRSSTPGYRPGQNGSRPLDDGEEFVNYADRIRQIGEMGVAQDDLPAYPLRPGIGDIQDAGEAAKLGVSTVEEAQEAQSDEVALTPAKGRTLLNALLGSTSAKATGVATIKAIAEWLADIDRFDRHWVDVSSPKYGASPTATPAVNTRAIQRAVNDLAALGGGFVHLPDLYKVTATTEQDVIASIARNQADQYYIEYVPLAGTTCIIGRSGVTFTGQDTNRSGLICENVKTTVLTFLDCDGGGARDIYVKNIWDPYTNFNGAGHGIVYNVSEHGKPNKNMRFHNVRVSHVGSYCFGFGEGDYVNNVYTGLHGHDCGADGFDHKVRTINGSSSRGVTIVNSLFERYGRRAGIVKSAGLDIRGPAHLHGVECLDFAWKHPTTGVSSGNTGIRFSAGIYASDGADIRLPSSRSTLSQFRIDAGKDVLDPSDGLVLFQSENTSISNGTIRNCTNVGVSSIISGSGFGSSDNVSLSGVTVIGSGDGTAFNIATPLAKLVNCHSVGDVDQFSAKAGNLAAGQTVFVCPYAFDPATVEIWKNGAKLAASDFTISANNKGFTLAAPVIASDVIDRVTPNSKGFAVGGAGVNMAQCTAKYTTQPIIPTGPALVLGGPGRLTTTGCDFGFGGYTDINENSLVRRTVYGPAADMDYRVDAKGNAAFEARANSSRAMRATTPSSGVNWLQFSGSVAGSPVIVSFQGADANGDVQFAPKGSGLTRWGTYTAGAPAATGYITMKAANGTTYKLLAST